MKLKNDQLTELVSHWNYLYDYMIDTQEEEAHYEECEDLEDAASIPTEKLPGEHIYIVLRQINDLILNLKNQ